MEKCGCRFWYNLKIRDVFIGNCDGPFSCYCTIHRQNYGAKKYKRIIRGIQLSTNFSIIYGLVVMFSFISFQKIASIFTDNQEVVSTRSIFPHHSFCKLWRKRYY